MPYQLSWFVRDRIIFVRLSGTLTAEDIATGSSEGLRYLEEGRAPVHALVDLSELESLGTPVYETIRLNKALEHPKRGWACIYGAHSTLIRNVLPIASTVFSLHYHLAESKTEAVQFLQGVDPTLPNPENP